MLKAFIIGGSFFFYVAIVGLLWIFFYLLSGSGWTVWILFAVAWIFAEKPKRNFQDDNGAQWKRP